MATTKITDLTAYTDPVSTDVLPIVDVTSDVTKKVSIADLMENAGSGSAAAPGISFDGDPNTGIYRPGADQIGVATNGTSRVTVSTTAVSSALPVDVLLGAAATPSYTFTGDLNTGIYSPGADQVAISTNGTGRLFVDASGRVGIGGTSDFAEFQIAGSAPSLYLKPSADTETSEIAFRNAANSQTRGFISYDHSDDSLRFRVNLSERLRITSTGELQFKGAGTIGSPGTPAVSFNGSAPSSSLVIDSTGKVGLGTSSPSYLLDVSGAAGAAIRCIGQGAGGIDERLFISSTGNGGTGRGAAITFTPAGSASSVTAARLIGYQLGASATADAAAFGIQVADSSGTLQTRLYINNSGSIGIGTAAPGNTLTVASANAVPVNIFSTQATQYLQLTTDSGGTPKAAGIFTTNDALGFFTSSSGTERARIDTSGRLLVGTSSTSATTRAVFQGNSANASGTGIVQLATGNTSPATGDQLGRLEFGGSTNVGAASIIGDRDGGTWTNGSSQPSRLTFSTTADGASSPTERMRIDSGGNLLIGTTSVYTSAKVSIAATKGFVTRPTSAVDYTPLAFEIFAGTQIGSITTSGLTTAYNTSSDYRLKENVVPLTGAIGRLNQLQVHRFNFIADPDRTVDGFIAHEAQAVVPECVTGEKDEVDDEGNPIYQGIDQSKLVPLLTAALQEAIAKIENLEAKVAALEAS